MAKVLNKEDSILLIVDVQEKLVSALDKDIVVKRVKNLANVAKLLEVPMIVTQQYSKGLGQTVSQVSQMFDETTKIVEKISFSAVQEDGFLDILKSFGRKQIVICGIETHICVHQTVADLLDAGFEVFVAKDACASRAKYEFKSGIERMQENGAKISCVEIILFEWLKTAKNPCFKEIQALVK